MAWYDYAAIIFVLAVSLIMLVRQVLGCYDFKLKVDVDAVPDARTGGEVCRARLAGASEWPEAARPEETRALHRAWTAAGVLWSSEVRRRRATGWRLWLVRSPDDYVVLAKPRRWGWVDEEVYHGTRDPGHDGYGGLTFFAVRGPDAIYVSTYKENRPTDALLLHELTHLLSGIAPHNEEFHRLEIEFRRIYDGA